MAIQDLYGWFPRNHMVQIPERSPQLTQPNQLPMGPLSEQAYQMAGRPNMKPGAGSLLASASYPDDEVGGGGAGAAGILGNVQQTKKVYDTAEKAGLLGTPLSSYGSGAALNNAVLGEVGYPAAFGATPGGMVSGAGAAGLLAGSGLGSSGAIASGAAANAALAEAGFGAGAAATGAGTGAATGGLGAALAGSGLSTALPLAGIGFALADYLNAGPLNDDKSKTRNIDSYNQYTGARQVNLPAGKTQLSYFAFPDGRLISAHDYNDLAGSWYGATYAPDGDQEGWQSKYDSFLGSVKDAQPPKGYRWDGTKFVRG